MEKKNFYVHTHNKKIFKRVFVKKNLLNYVFFFILQILYVHRDEKMAKICS